LEIITKEMLESSKNKILELFKQNNYKLNVHFVHGFLQEFYFIEFLEPFTKEYIIMMALKYKEDCVFYDIKCHFDDFTNSFETPLEVQVSTQNDLEAMRFNIDDVTDLAQNNSELTFSVGTLNKRKEYPCGYYLNHRWQSNIFPEQLRKKILSADKYITLINEHSELLIVMEHNGMSSLFYSCNDQ